MIRYIKILSFGLLFIWILDSCVSGKSVPPVTVIRTDTIRIIEKDTVYVEKEWSWTSDTLVPGSHIIHPILDSLIDHSPVLSPGFSGLAIYDPENKSYLYTKNSHKYFTPASNTKIFTLNACLRLLGDSIPAFRYVETDQTLILWPTGDPSFLHAYMPESQVLEFIKNRSDKKIIISLSHAFLDSYGRGWMWDDYNDYYQTELTPMPLYGNVVTFFRDKYNILNTPHLDSWTIASDAKVRKVSRKKDANSFKIPLAVHTKRDFKQEVPYTQAQETNIHLLEKLTGSRIFVENIPLPEVTQTLHSISVDTVLRLMMQESDNFLAEHLLLLMGMELMDTLNPGVTLNFIQENLHTILTHPPVWADGSGLSRYNKMTPQSICELLTDMYEFSPQKLLFSYMAKGGTNGTLKSLFNKPPDGPHIYAKSGTLTGVYNLSGYIVTQKGKTLVFSFMNNHFTVPASQVRKEVEKIMNTVYKIY